MAKPEPIELGYTVDDSDYYLIGDKVWYGSVFTNYTLSAIERGPEEEVFHSLSLDRLAHTLPEAQSLVADGWRRGIFVGKLMTSDPESEQALAKKKTKPLELIERLAQREVGFQTRLFVVQPILGLREELVSIERLPEQADPQLVAAVHHNGHRSLRIVSADQDEHHYGEHIGKHLSPDQMGESSWQAIETFQRSLYDQTTDTISAGALDGLSRNEN